MELIPTAAALAERLARHRAEGGRSALLSLGGGVHEGHLSIIRATQDEGYLSVACLSEEARPHPAEPVPGPPPDRDADLRVLGAADIVFTPPPEGLLPAASSTRLSVGAFADSLCAQHRPGYFDRAALAAVKLMSLTRADRMEIGEKDWQGALVIGRVATDLGIGTRIVVVPTRRDAEGLALSSRNRSLSGPERRIAPRLHAEIDAAARRIAGGTPTELSCAEAQENLIIAGFAAVDFLECRDAATLRPAPAPGQGARVFAAARLGRVRLIDSVAVPH